MAYRSEFSREEPPKRESLPTGWWLAVAAGITISAAAIWKLLPEVQVPGKADILRIQRDREAHALRILREREKGDADSRNARYISLLQMQMELQVEEKELKKRLYGTPDANALADEPERKLAVSMQMTVEILDHNWRVTEFNGRLEEFPEFTRGKIHGETDKPVPKIERMEEMMPFRVPANGVKEANKGRIEP